MRLPHKLQPLAHHMVSPRPARLVDSYDGPLCTFCSQPVEPPYTSTRANGLLHPHCATELHIQKLEAKLDLLTKRFNLMEGLVE